MLQIINLFSLCSGGDFSPPFKETKTMTTATKPAKKKVTKKTARKSPSVKKHPKGKGTGTKKKTVKASTNGKVKKAESVTGKLNELKIGSTRVRMFKALNKYPGGLTPRAIKEKTGMSNNSGHLAVIFKEEIEKKRIRIETHDVNERDVRFYLITPLGIKDLKSGNIDKTSMGGRRIGQKWTNKRRTADKASMKKTSKKK